MTQRGRQAQQANDLRARLVPKQPVVAPQVTLKGALNPLAKSQKHSHQIATALPPLPDPPVKETVAELKKEVENEATQYESIIDQFKTPFEFIDYAKKHNLKKEYVFLRSTGEIETAELPTNLVPLPRANVDTKQREVWTLSLEGLTHIRNGDVDFIPLESWLNSIEKFKRLLQIPFFKKHREWKFFSLWKRGVQCTKVSNSLQRINADFFFANQTLRNSFLQVRAALNELQRTKLFSLRSDGAYTLQQFIDENSEYRQTVTSTFESYYKKITKIVQEACERSLDELTSPERFQNAKKGARPLDMMIEHYKSQKAKPAGHGGRNLAEMSYTQKASYKALCFKLVRFIKLVDYHVIGCLRYVCFTSLLELYSIFRHLYNVGAAKTGFENEVGPIKDLSLSPEFVRVYEIIKGRISEVYHSPIFRIDFSFTNDQLIYSPGDNEIIDLIGQVRNDFIDVIFKFPRLIVNPIFAPLHNADTDDALFNPESINVPDLGQILFNDELFKETSTNQNAMIISSISMLNFFTKNFDSAIKVFRENENFDISFMNDDATTASDIKSHINDIRDQEKLMKSIAEKSDVGLLCVYTQKMRSLFITSPGKCMQMVRVEIPTITKRNLTKLEANIHRAFTSLTAEITDVKTYVDYILAVEKYNEEVKSLKAHMDLIKEFFKLATDQAAYIPTDMENEFSELQPILDEIKTNLIGSRDKMDELSRRFVTELEKNVDDLHSRVRVLQELANTPELHNIETHHKQIARIFVVLIAKTDEIKKLADDYDFYQRKIGVQGFKFNDVNDLVKDVKYKQLLWETLSEWRVSTATWYEMDFTTVDVDKIAAEIEGYHASAMEALKNLPGNAVCEEFMGMIEDFKNLLPVIKDLNNKALKDEHKERIDTLIGGKVFEKGLYKIKYLYDLQAFNLAKDIAHVTEQASNEQTLLDHLHSVKDTIDNMQFNLTTGPNLKVFFGGIEDILFSIEDVKATIATVRSSHYVSTLRASADEWVRSLSAFEKAVRKLDRAQKLWDFISGILHSTDTLRQVPNSKDITTLEKLWKGLYVRAKDDPNAFKVCMSNQTLPDLDQAIELLEKTQASIIEALETKRAVFPRLYFISDEQLLKLIAMQKEPFSIKQYLPFFFDGIANYYIETENHVPFISAVLSAEGEVLKLTQVKYRSNVEAWLQNLDEISKRSLRFEFKNDDSKYHEMVHEGWIANSLAQSGFVLSQVYFTESIELAFTTETPLKSITNLKNETQARIDLFSNLMRTKLEPLEFKKFTNYIMLLCRQRDLLNFILNKQIFDANSWFWISKIKFKFDENKKDILVTQGDFCMRYGFEFSGTAPRMPITPDTAQIFNYITVALNSKLPVLLSGPPDVGKNSLITEIARMFGIFSVQFYCDPGLKIYQIANTCRGVIHSGVWGAFIDIDRLNEEALSVISENLIHYRDSNFSGIKKFNFHGVEIPINPSSAFFATTTSGTKNHTALPSNFRSLFRIINLPSIDMVNYISIKLLSIGIPNSQEIAQKIKKLLHTYSLYAAMKTEKQIFNISFEYMKEMSVEEPEMDEQKLVVFALNHYAERYLRSDLKVIFENLIKENFPNVEVLVEELNPDYLKMVRFCIQNLGLTCTDELCEKVLHVNDVVSHHKAIIFVGDSDSGKSTMINVLIELHKMLSYSNRGVPPVEVHRIFPNSFENQDLIGYYDEKTNKANIGRIEMESIAGDPVNQQWFVFDGLILPLWMESFNTAISYGGTILFPSGMRVPRHDSTRLIFESRTISYASPATLVRCAVINFKQDFVEPNQVIEALTLKYIEPLFKKDTQKMQLAKFKELCETSIKVAFNYYTELVEAKPLHVTFLCCIRTFFKLITSLISEEEFHDENGTHNLTIFFVFAFIWGFGGFMDNNQRNIFDTIVRDTFNNIVVIPVRGLVFDWFVQKVEPEYQWASYADSVPKFVDIAPADIEINPATVKAYNVIVPTLETERTKHLIKLLVKGRHDVLLSGEPGIGKSLLINTLLQDLEKNEDMHNIEFLFSPFYNRNNFEEVFISRMQMSKGSELYPTGDKHSILFIDGLNSPQPSDEGVNTVNEFLRELLEYRTISSHCLKKRLTIRNTSLIGISTLTMMNPIDKSLASKFVNLTMMPLTSSSEFQIFQSVLTVMFNNYPEAVRNSVSRITNTLIYTLESIDKIFTKNIETPWIFFNLHDFGRVLASLLKSSDKVITDQRALERFFTHEIMRIYSDQMNNEADYKKFTDMFEGIAKNKLGSDQKPAVLFGSYFGDFTRSIHTIDEEVSVIQEYRSLEDVIKVFDLYLEDFNYSKLAKSKSVVILTQTATHLTRLCRSLRFSRGHAMLIGPYGSGKRTVARLASFIMDADCIEFDDNTLQIDEVKTNLMRAGVNGKRVVLLVTLDKCSEYKAMELANLLITGVGILTLFTNEELDRICTDICQYSKKIGKGESNQQLLHLFKERVLENMHCIVSIQDDVPTLMKYCSIYPSLVRFCDIDYFNHLKDQDLITYGDDYMKANDSDQSVNKDGVLAVSTFIYKTMEKYSSMLDSTVFNYVLSPFLFVKYLRTCTIVFNKFKAQAESQIAPMKAALERFDNAEKIMELSQHEVNEITKKMNRSKDNLDDVYTKIVTATQKHDKLKAKIAEEEKNFEEENTRATKLLREIEDSFGKINKDYKAAAEEFSKFSLDEIDEVVGFETVDFPFLTAVVSVICLLADQQNTTKGTFNMLFKDNLFPQKLSAKFNEANHVTPKTLGKIKEILAATDQSLENLPDSFLKLAKFVLTLVKFEEAFPSYQPKQTQYQQLLASIRTRTATIKRKYQKLEIISDQIAEHQSQNEVGHDAYKLGRRKDELKARMDKFQAFKQAMQPVLDQWKNKIQEINDKQKYNVSNTMLCTLYFIYLGPFDAESRAKIVAEVITKIKEMEFEVDPDFKFEHCFVTPATIRKWISMGLPPNTRAVENAVIIKYGFMVPYIYDPNEVCLSWLKKVEEANQIAVLQPGMQNYSRIIETCARNGKSAVIENFTAASFDPFIDAFLSRNTTTEKGKYLAKVGERSIEVDCHFTLFLLTSSTLQAVSPEVFQKTVVVSFKPGRVAFQRSISNAIIRQKKPELEEKYNSTIEMLSMMERNVKSIEERLIDLCTQKDANLIDDDVLGQAIKDLKDSYLSESQKYAELKTESAKLEQQKEEYNEVARQISLVFYLLTNLSRYNPLYKFSTETIMQALCDALPDTDDTNILSVVSSRLVNRVVHTMNVKDRILVLFLVSVSILIDRGESSMDEYYFLAHVRTVKPFIENPAPKSIVQNYWLSLSAAAEKVKPIHDLMLKVTNDPTNFIEWIKTPTKRLEGLTIVQELIVTRIFKANYVFVVVRDLIAKVFGESSVHLNDISMQNVFSNKVASQYPMLILTNSNSMDQRAFVRELLMQRELESSPTKRFTVILSDDYSEKTVMSVVEDTVNNSGVVFLPNIHLNTSICNIFNNLKNKITKNFRIVATTHKNPLLSPIATFCYKIHLKNPSLTDTMITLSSYIDKIMLKSATWTRIIYMALFIHASFCVRRHLWSSFAIQYSFGIPEWCIICSGLRQIQKRNINPKPDVFPLDEVKHVILNDAYGGLICADYDKITCTKIVNALIQFNSPFTQSVVLPKQGGIDEIMRCIKAMDDYDCFIPHHMRFQMTVERNILLSITRINEFFEESNSNTIYEQAASVLQQVLANLPVIEDIGSTDEMMQLSDPLMMVLSKEIRYLRKKLATIHASATHLLNVAKRVKPPNASDVEKIVKLSEYITPKEWDIGFSPRLVNSWRVQVTVTADFFKSWVRRGKPKVFQASAFRFLRIMTRSCKMRSMMSMNVPMSQFLMKLTPLETEPEEPPQDVFIISGFELLGARLNENGEVTAAASETTQLKFVSIQPVLKDSLDKSYVPIPVYRSTVPVPVEDFWNDVNYGGTLMMKIAEGEEPMLRLIGVSLLIPTIISYSEVNT